MSTPLYLNPEITVISAPPLKELVRATFDRSVGGLGALDDSVYNIHGFCGRKHRLFHNNLLNSMPGARYLEIGLYKGATFCASIWQNRLFAVGVDNWSEMQDHNASPEFYRNLSQCKNQQAVVNILEMDFRKAPLQAFDLFNIGFYDGAHEEEDQYDGALAVLKRLAGEGVLIVDDWNWRQVRRGTHRAIADLGATVDLAIEVRTTNDDSLVPSEGFGGGSDWHNGVFVAVISQRR
jgi:hypothetical protein